MYPYVPISTLLFCIPFDLSDLRPMQSHKNLTERQNQHPIATAYANIKHYQKHLTVFYAKEKLPEIFDPFALYITLLNLIALLSFASGDLRPMRKGTILTKSKTVHPISIDYASIKHHQKYTAEFYASKKVNTIQHSSTFLLSSVPY
jgi:hypothetical protein